MSAQDLEEIRNVLALYCHVVDGRQWQRIGEVFAPDGSYSARGSDPRTGLEALIAYYSSAVNIGAIFSTNHHIELSADGMSGTGVGKFLVLLPDATIVAGDYEDRYVKTTEGWRLQHRSSSVTVPSRT